MKITQESDYALRIIQFLSISEESTVGASIIAEKQKVPLRFALKILRKLNAAGLTKAYRGVSGGYSLAKDPNQITVAHLMRIIDGPIALIPCVSERYYESCGECVDEETCRIRKLFGELRAEMLPVLDKTIVELARL
mgnify:CR=1 FL=1